MLRRANKLYNPKPRVEHPAETPPPIQWRQAGRTHPIECREAAERPVGTVRSCFSRFAWGNRPLGMCSALLYILYTRKRPQMGKYTGRRTPRPQRGPNLYVRGPGDIPYTNIQLLSKSDSWSPKSTMGKCENHAVFYLFPHGEMYFPTSQKKTIEKH